MPNKILFSLLCAALCGCGRSEQNDSTAQGASGSGAVYGRGGAGKDDHQRAQENATDTRPRGGSMPGAGGAGPGYDGSHQGTKERDFVPAPGAGFGGALTNANAATNTTSAPGSNPGPGQQR